MARQTDDKEKMTLRKLHAMVEELKKRRDWTDDEVEVIEKVIKVYEGLSSLGILAGGIKTIALWFLAIAAFITMIRLGLIDWLKIPGGPQ